MQYSTNYNMNKPELSEQYRLSHWNENTDIIDSAMQAIRSGTDEVMKATLLNFCYPIGSLYWSSKSTNPASLFGGTWVQIKDRFVLACGDTYTSSGATGGASTVTLSVDNMPSHTHSFKGTEATTTSTVTGAGSFTSKDLTGKFSGGKTDSQGTNASYYNRTNGIITLDGKAASYKGESGPMALFSINANHQHRFTPSGTIENTGSGSSFSILPPYVVKYCWERTA